ncbi:hypothetical protein EST38_g13640 [Candolleomyces aberdarensis]|uniref:Uncharacterized protein n=1 Tax=Candolleomyces aberdarensis TaxID=2316362 RepID=A0A4Q2D1Q4_9AGAR|nr:hypothetical protein EST38_g13640 [Candolleomyces aberdarensis]
MTPVPSAIRGTARYRGMRPIELFLDQIKVKQSIEEKRQDTAIFLDFECPQLCLELRVLALEHSG